MTLTPEERAKWSRRHVRFTSVGRAPVGASKSVCECCERLWPCDVARLLASHAEADARIEELEGALQRAADTFADTRMVMQLIGRNKVAKAMRIAGDDARTILAAKDEHEAAPATYESERAAVIRDVGECCRGADPACAGGCLVERALRKRVAALAAKETR